MASLRLVCGHQPKTKELLELLFLFFSDPWNFLLTRSLREKISPAWNRTEALGLTSHPLYQLSNSMEIIYLTSEFQKPRRRPWTCPGSSFYLSDARSCHFYIYIAPFLFYHLITEKRKNVWMLWESNLGDLAPAADTMHYKRLKVKLSMAWGAAYRA